MLKFVIILFSCSILVKSQENILIGDSQCKHIEMNSSNVKIKKSLQKIGIGLLKLNQMVLREPKDYNIKNVFVSIGVNDNYRYQEIGFIKNLKKTFPNAKIYMIPGSYG